MVPHGHPISKLLRGPSGKLKCIDLSCISFICSFSVFHSRIKVLTSPMSCTSGLWSWLNNWRFSIPYSVQLSKCCSCLSDSARYTVSSSTLCCYYPAKICEFACFIETLSIYSNWFRAFPVYSLNSGFLITHSEARSPSQYSYSSRVFLSCNILFNIFSISL